MLNSVAALVKMLKQTEQCLYKSMETQYFHFSVETKQSLFLDQIQVKTGQSIAPLGKNIQFAIKWNLFLNELILNNSSRNVFHLYLFFRPQKQNVLKV